MLGGTHQRRPAISIDGIHIGPVRPGQRVHSGRVAFLGGTHQCRPAMLSTASTLAPCVPASAFTVSVWPFRAAYINAVQPCSIDGIHIGPVRPGQRVHGVRVAILGGTHQCRPAIVYRQHPHWPRASRPARSQCPCGHSRRQSSMPSAPYLDSIHIGPVRPNQRGYQGQVHTRTARAHEAVSHGGPLHVLNAHLPDRAQHVCTTHGVPVDITRHVRQRPVLSHDGLLRVE